MAKETKSNNIESNQTGDLKAEKLGTIATVVTSEKVLWC